MILTDIPQIPSISGINVIPDNADINRSAEQSSPGFLGLIHKLDNTVSTSDQAIQSYILKEGISTHELMIALQNAKHSLQVAVEVRNKIVEAYEKVTRMSI